MWFVCGNNRRNRIGETLRQVSFMWILLACMPKIQAIDIAFISREISKDTPSLSCFLSFSPSILPQLLPQCHWDVTLCCGGVSVLTSNTPFMANPDHHSCLGTVREGISSQKKVLFELWYSGSERIKSGEDGWYTPYLEEKK